MYARDPVANPISTIPYPNATIREIMVFNNEPIRLFVDNVRLSKTRRLYVDSGDNSLWSEGGERVTSGLILQQPVEWIYGDLGDIVPILGYNKITMYMYDEIDNQSPICWAAFTILDIEAPEFQGCPTTSITIDLNDTRYCDGALCNFTYTYNATDWLGVGKGTNATDATRGVMLVPEVAVWQEVALGTTPYSETFVDPAGNTATCDFDLIVQDLGPPTVYIDGVATRRRRRRTMTKVKIDRFVSTMGNQVGIGFAFPEIYATDNNGVYEAVFAERVITYRNYKSKHAATIGSEQTITMTCQVLSVLTDPTQVYESDNCFDDSLFFAGNHTFTYTATDASGNTGVNTFDINIIDEDLQAIIDAQNEATVIGNGNANENANNGNGNNGNGNGRRRLRNLLQVDDSSSSGSGSDDGGGGIFGVILFKTSTVYPFEVFGLARAPEYDAQLLTPSGEGPVEQFLGSYAPSNCDGGDQEMVKNPEEVCIQHFKLEFEVVNCTSLSSLDNVPVIRLEFETRCRPNAGDLSIAGGGECRRAPTGIPIILTISAADYCDSFLDSIGLSGQILVVENAYANAIADAGHQWTHSELRTHGTTLDFYLTVEEEEEEFVQVCFATLIEGESIGGAGVEDFEILSVTVANANLAHVRDWAEGPSSEVALEWKISTTPQSSNVLVGCFNETKENFVAGTTTMVEMYGQVRVDIEYILFNSQGSQRRRAQSVDELISKHQNTPLQPHRRKVTQTPVGSAFDSSLTMNIALELRFHGVDAPTTTLAPPTTTTTTTTKVEIETEELTTVDIVIRGCIGFAAVMCLCGLAYCSVLYFRYLTHVYKSGEYLNRHNNVKTKDSSREDTSFSSAEGDEGAHTIATGAAENEAERVFPNIELLQRRI